MSTDDEMINNRPAGDHARGPDAPLWRRPLVLGVVGAAAAAAVVITVVSVTADDAIDPGLGDPGTTMTLSVAAADPMLSCLPVADIVPAEGSVALAGTVTSADGNHVVIDVDRWYAGGDAARVELEGTEQGVALDGVAFTVGEEYLVTAVDGVVQPCGVSGTASPELEALYEQWYR